MKKFLLFYLFVFVFGTNDTVFAQNQNLRFKHLKLFNGRVFEDLKKGVFMIFIFIFTCWIYTGARYRIFYHISQSDNSMPI